MNSKKESKLPQFAEVTLTCSEFTRPQERHCERARFFLKLVYPNDVTLILPGDISASQLEQYVRIKV